MTWIPLLLSDPSPCLRYLVLRDLLKRPIEDPEVKELLKLREEDLLITELVKLQKSSGAWDAFSFNRIALGDNIHITSMALQRLGYLGFDLKYSFVKKGAEFIFSQQQEDGSWLMPGKNQSVDEEKGYQMMPIQTAIPLLGLVMCGYAEDKRAEQAYEWLISKRLDDGAWPVGIASGNYGGIAGYRRLAHSRWGCRSNTTAVLTCMAYHPKRRISEEAKQALDLILGTNMKLRTNLGFLIARLIGLEKSIGRITYMAKFDIAHILNLCWRVEASVKDSRIAEFVEFIKSEQGPYGLWEYINHPQATRWLTFDLLRSLSKLETQKDWISLEPLTPFRSYPKKIKRF